MIKQYLDRVAFFSYFKTGLQSGRLINGLDQLFSKPANFFVITAINKKFAGFFNYYGNNTDN